MGRSRSSVSSNSSPKKPKKDENRSKEEDTQTFFSSLTDFFNLGLDKEILSKTFSQAISASGFLNLKELPLYSRTIAGQMRQLICPRCFLKAWISQIKKHDKNLVKGVKAAQLVDLNLEDCERITVSKLPKLIGHHRRLEAINNVIMNGSPLLKSLKRSIDSGKVRRLLAFDVEAFEFDHRRLLELGAALYIVSSSSDPPNIQTWHFVMHENERKQNGKYCANNRDNYMFGKTQVKRISEVFEWLMTEMSQPHTAIVGHNLQADLRYLCQAIGSTTVKFNHGWLRGRQHFDTQAIFKEVYLRPHEEKLEKLLRHFGIEHGYLHNAGNDAYYTLITALKLADLPHTGSTPM